MVSRSRDEDQQLDPPLAASGPHTGPTTRGTALFDPKSSWPPAGHV
jgi:hypothetical protein